MTDLSKLASAGTSLDLLVADVKGEIKYTVLPAAKAKRSQLVFTTGTRSTGFRAAGVKVRGGSGCNAAVPTSQWHN